MADESSRASPSKDVRLQPNTQGARVQQEAHTQLPAPLRLRVSSSLVVARVERIEGMSCVWASSAEWGDCSGAAVMALYVIAVTLAVGVLCVLSFALGRLWEKTMEENR